MIIPVSLSNLLLDRKLSGSDSIPISTTTTFVLFIFSVTLFPLQG